SCVRVQMRTPSVIALISVLCLAGCTSTSGIDSLQLDQPSNETTSSVVRPSAPIAASAVASVEAAPACPDSSSPSAPMPPMALADPDGLATSAAKSITLVAPTKHAVQAEPAVARTIYGYGF